MIVGLARDRRWRSRVRRLSSKLTFCDEVARRLGVGDVGGDDALPRGETVERRLDRLNREVEHASPSARECPHPSWRVTASNPCSALCESPIGASTPELEPNERASALQRRCFSVGAGCRSKSRSARRVEATTESGMAASVEGEPSGCEEFDRARELLAEFRDEEALDYFELASGRATDAAVRASAAAFVAWAAAERAPAVGSRGVGRDRARELAVVPTSATSSRPAPGSSSTTATAPGACSSGSKTRATRGSRAR